MSENLASARAEDKSEPRRQKSAPKKSGESSKASLNMAELRELAELVNEHGFTDFEFENENIRVRLSRTATVHAVQAPAPVQVNSPAASTPASEADAAPVPIVEPEAELYKITSPIVGTFYRAPSPDKEPYAKEGDMVSESTVVCIVEAMKLMNEIMAETTGQIVKIYVENGQPVEFGQPLFGVKR
jgi:acetyl-CoA carboxylase biotin carboxyl carrier protein